MLGNKITKQHIIKAFKNTRHFLGGAYSHGKNSLGSIDNGITFAKHAYGVISPLLDKYASNHSNSINKSVMNAVKSYDDIKHKALETHDNLYNDYNTIKHKLLTIYRNNIFHL
jgi:midasin (ATPase involved in ribosome maturation)